jgi:hypothetical protein
VELLFQSSVTHTTSTYLGHSMFSHMHGRNQQLDALSVPRQVRLEPRNIIFLANCPSNLHPSALDLRASAQHSVCRQMLLILLGFLLEVIDRASALPRSLLQGKYLVVLVLMQVESSDLL